MQTVGKRARKVVLVGPPNVGKSALFQQITGNYSSISNYPGTTVEIFQASTRIRNCTYEFTDTPGIHSLLAGSQDERVTLRLLEEEKPDLILQVADGRNLAGTLLLTAQLSRLGRPMVLDLNMKDEREQMGVHIDCRELSRRLGIPVIETVASTGQGMEEIRRALKTRRLCSLQGEQPFAWVEDTLLRVKRQTAGRAAEVSGWGRLSAALLGAGAILHLEGVLGGLLAWPTLEGGVECVLQSQGTPQPLASAAGILLGSLLPLLVPFLWAVRHNPRFARRFGVWARRPWSGPLILLLVLSMIYQFVGRMGAGLLVDFLEGGLFRGCLTPWLAGVAPLLLRDFLTGPYGLVSVGLSYGVAIVLPVVFTFFLAFGFLEDSGYLPRLSILADRLLRAMGLEGKALLPMVLGLGCVTMATLTTRVLPSRKERIIATLLLALGVPCSAQLGVILGVISGVSGWPAAAVLGTVFLQLMLVGAIASRLLPGKRSPFILEVPPIRYPGWGNIVRKTWLRVRWFLREALPLFLLGTMLLFLLARLNLLEALVNLLEPVTSGFLDLPRGMATVFFMGFLRRDFGAAGIYQMVRNHELDSIQTVVSLSVMTLFIPCVANLLMIIREQGARVAAAMVAFITGYALLAGGLLNFVVRTVLP